MADTSRDDLLRQADGFVRQGRIDAAIGAYEQLVQLPPRDWNLIKQLADLQERAGHREAAAVRFLQCADYDFGEGFLARAVALYRKVLKLDAKSEHALGKLADVSLELKLTMDARQALLQLVALRRARGDEPGALAAVARLSALQGVTVRTPAPEIPPEPVSLPEPQPTSEPEPEPRTVPWAPLDEPGADFVAVDPFVPVRQPAEEPAQVLGEEPAPAASPPDVAPAHGFDWGALLGRDVVPPEIHPEPPPGTVDAAALEAVEVWQSADVEETDLTELLDQLVDDRLPSFSAAALPGSDAPADVQDSLPVADAEWPLLPEASSQTGDARTLAAQQLAAGRVFAAAGLVAEAARSFERASRDVRTRFEAAEALGSLHRSRGQLTEAVRWYDEAAQAPVADEAVRHPVLYDLAEALEAVGQPGRALAVLLDLLSEVEDYRDARARADRLFRVDAGG